MNKIAYGTINKIDEAIKDNEESIKEMNRYIRLAKANGDVEAFVDFKDIKRQYKNMNKRLRQSKKSLMKNMANYAEEIDKNTKDTQSNIPLTKQYLQANYRVTNTFNDVSLNTINDNLPVRLSYNALSKLVKEVFPEVRSRKCSNDIKYNMEMII